MVKSLASENLRRIDMVKKTFSLVLVIMFSLLFMNTAIFATPAVLEPCAFETKSDQKDDWYWLRNEGDYVKWVFNPLDMSGGIVPKSMYLIVKAKVTNQVNGGSGYEATLKMRVTGNGATDIVKVRLHNPFRPTDPETSGGLGYDTYGWGGPIRDRIWQGSDEITVTMEHNREWKEAYQGNIQVAFKKDDKTMSVVLSYMH
jgi:hypothetical protein